MRKKNFSCKLIALLVMGAGSIHSIQASSGQEYDHPVLNGFGRFLGIGWSHGYHSPTNDGRFQLVKDRHPAYLYGSSALTYPYDRNYESAPNQFQSALTPAQYSQVGPGIGMASPYAVVPIQGTQGKAGFGAPFNTPTPAPPIHVPPLSPGPITVPAPKPIEPPPTWLRPYLKDEENGEVPVELSPAEVPKDTDDTDLLIPDNSPSDLPPPRTSSPEAESDDDDLLIPQTNLSPMQRYYQAKQNQPRNL